MSTSTKRRLDSSDRACIQCQRRKTRCMPSENGEACFYCHKNGKSCEFGDPPSRTPLTRKNLDEIESRCRRLEALIKTLQPSVDVDGVLNGKSLDYVSTSGPNANSTAHSDHLSTVASHTTIPHSYEWQEAVEPRSGQLSPSRTTRQDGMASLGAHDSQAGYLGDTAGSSLLGSVSSMLLERSQKQRESRQIAINGPSDAPNPSDFSSITSRLNASVWHAHLIDLYFASYNTYYPIIHEHSFREQQNVKWRLPSNSPWHIVYYIVLAIGEWVGGYSNEDQSVFYDAARSRLHIEIFESGNLGVVEAFTLLGNYLQKRDRPNTGYNFIGIAYRVALGLGLHREIASTDKPATFHLQRRRLLFWTLYCLESGFSLTTGRPTLVSDSFIDARKPQNIDDSRCTAGSELPAEVDYPTGCTAIASQARLAVITNRIHTDFLSARNCTNVDHQIAILEQAIQNWRETLPASFFDDNVPSWFLGPRQVVLWKETNLRILLLLAGQRHQTDEDDKAALGARCQNVAIRAIDEVTHFCYTYPELIHQGLSWYAVYFLLQSALALGVHQIKERRKSSQRQTVRPNNAARERWDSALVKACQCLEMLGEKNSAANRTLRLLDRLRQNTMSSDGSTESEYSVSPNTTPAQSHTRSAHTGTQNDQLNQASAMAFSGPSPTPAIARNIASNEWVASADPSLHMFFDNAHNIDRMFDNVQGFPSTMEQDNFAYMTSSYA